LLGTTYGAGDGSTTFNLPDSRGRVAVNKNAADAQFATIGQKFGEKTHIMSLAELPSHSHAQYVTALTNGSSIRTDYKSDSYGGTYAQNISTDPNGGSAPYNVIQPSITKMFAIKY
jgi:microcystin-dependent protein